MLPFMAVHPGSILKDELEARGIAPSAFAVQSGISKQELEGILDEKRDVDSNVAARLEGALGISSVFWMSLQNDFVKDSKAIKARKKAKTHSILEKLPWNRVAF